MNEVGEGDRSRGLRSVEFLGASSGRCRVHPADCEGAGQGALAGPAVASGLQA